MKLSSTRVGGPVQPLDGAIRAARLGGVKRSIIRLLAALLALAAGLAPACLHAQGFALGTTNLLVGPQAGADSVLLAAPTTNAAWSAAGNADWLHLAVTNGTGSTNIILSFDANSGDTRTALLTVSDRTLAVTQAGVDYTPANPVTILSGDFPEDLAIDADGNLYFSDALDGYICFWRKSTGVQEIFLRNSAAFDSPYPTALAIDSSGELYFANSGIYIFKVPFPFKTMLVTTLNVVTYGMALDRNNNIIVTDCGNGALKEVIATNGMIVTLISSGLNEPLGVALDSSGNAYIADSGNNAIKEWVATTGQLVTLVSAGLNHPDSVAVDGFGNVYFSDYGNSLIKQWSAATGEVMTLGSGGLNGPIGVAVDGDGNVFIADSGNCAIKELVRGFVKSRAKTEGASRGSDSLPVLLPHGLDLQGVLAPASDSSWLNIGVVSNGVVNFSFTANTTETNRVGHLAVLGVPITVTQLPESIGAPVLIGATSTTNGGFQLNFTYSTGVSFTVFSSTDVTLPLPQWSNLGAALEAPAGSGRYQFTDPAAPRWRNRFYQVQGP